MSVLTNTGASPFSRGDIDGFLSPRLIALWNILYRLKGRALFGRGPSPVAVSLHKQINKGPALNHNKQVLEIGCGYGRDVFYLARHGYDVTGVDPCIDAIKLARKEYKDRYFSGSGLFVEGTAASLLANREGPFDAIFANRFFHFVADGLRKEFSSEAACLLKSGGRLIISARSADDFDPQTMEWVDEKAGKAKSKDGKISSIPFLNERLLRSAFSKDFVIERCYSVTEHEHSSVAPMKLIVIEARKRPSAFPLKAARHSVKATRHTYG